MIMDYIGIVINKNNGNTGIVAPNMDTINTRVGCGNKLDVLRNGDGTYTIQITDKDGKILVQKNVRRYRIYVQ